MRDHRKLEAFRLADALALDVYRETRGWPREELYGLISQVRRAAVSVPSNIVEGCAGHGEAEYIRFLDIAFGSLKECWYQLSLAYRLDFMDEETFRKLNSQCNTAARCLAGLIRGLRTRSPKPVARSPRPEGGQ